MTGWHRCTEEHSSGKRCLLVVHPSNVPHCTIGRRGWVFWGGRCEKCGLPAELSHEACDNERFRIEENKR